MTPTSHGNQAGGSLMQLLAGAVIIFMVLGFASWSFDQGHNSHLYDTSTAGEISSH